MCYLSLNRLTVYGAVTNSILLEQTFKTAEGFSQTNHEGLYFPRIGIL